MNGGEALNSSNRRSGRRIRVCFISPNAYGLLWPSSGCAFGGAEVQIYTLARELARDPRFDVCLLTGGSDRAEKKRDRELTIVLHALCGKRPRQEIIGMHGGDGNAGKELEGVWPWFVEHGTRWLNQRSVRQQTALRSVLRGMYSCRRWFTSSPLFRRLVDGQRECREIVRWARLMWFIGADIYVMRCASPQVGYMRIACTLMRRKFVYMVAHEYDVSGVYARTHGVWGQRFEYGLEHADAVVCQHADQVNLVRSRYHRGACVIRSLCPFRVHQRPETDRKTVLWMARADSWKQPEIFIELARRMPETSFVMVAPPSQIDPQNLPRLLKDSEDLPNLCLLPGVPLEETTALFEGAMLFINTSQFEGFPNTFLQAAACGTPIVSWAVNPEGVLEHNEMGYCADRDWMRFEQVVRRLCADTALRVRMGQHGRRYVEERHHPSAIAKEYAELFSNLHNDRAAA